MRIKKVNSDAIKLYETSMVKLKTAGNTREVQFMAGNNNRYPMAYTNGSVEDFASIFAGQYETMKAAGMLGEDNEMTQKEFLEQFYKQGEFTHDSSNPFLNFVSSVLDITIIKPVIEACTGEDLITGEDLTDLERGLKVVFAVVDLVTLGGAVAATKLSEAGLKEALKAFGKTVAVDFAGNTAACGVGALGEAFDWPVPVTIMLSLAAGITVSISGTDMLFKNADGIEIGRKPLDEGQLKIVGETLEESLNIESIKSNFVNKINDIRGKMPTTKLSKRGNMAMADVDIPGIKDSFVAHSGINSGMDKGVDFADFSYLKPAEDRIFTTYVEDRFPRYHDTEAKILEDIAAQIKDQNVSGTINLYSELSCCQSCSNIILEFRRMYPNIKLNVYVE